MARGEKKGGDQPANELGWKALAWNALGWNSGVRRGSHQARMLSKMVRQPVHLYWPVASKAPLGARSITCW